MSLILLDLCIVLLTIDTHVYISRVRELNLKMTEILKQDYNKTAPFT